MNPSSRESEWTRIQTTAAKKTLVLGQLKIATHNLFVLTNKHLGRRIPAHEHEDTLLQLGMVGAVGLLHGVKRLV